MNQLTDTTNPPISGIEIDAIFGAITLTVDSPLWGAQSAQDERSYIFASHVPIIY